MKNDLTPDSCQNAIVIGSWRRASKPNSRSLVGVPFRKTIALQHPTLFKRRPYSGRKVDLASIWVSILASNCWFGGWLGSQTDGSQSMNEESPTRASARDKEAKGNASLRAQGEIFKTLQDMSLDWMSCATTEVDLGLKLSNNLIAAHSLPDAIAAYADWMSKEMEARGEDARRMSAYGQKFMATGSRLLSNAWLNGNAMS
jgi:hypothetical protein